MILNRLFLCFNFINFAFSSPNFVLILTDDQDTFLGSMQPMQRTIDLIGKRGVTFTNAHANSPICCPSRSTILTGKFLHNLGVKNNSISGNCSSKYWQDNYEPLTIANMLKTHKNYTTFYAGKYLNQYGTDDVGGLKHVPKGYDWWIGLQGNSVYYNYNLSINGTLKHFNNDYLTDVIKNYALDFLNQGGVNNKPFFMMLSPPAAHAPFTPAPRHKNKFFGVKAPRTPSFNFSAGDKHWLVGKPPKHLPFNISNLDKIYQNRLETLLSVDELIDEIFWRIKEINLLQETYFIFTSDHGFHIGQFAQPWDKRQPYESDVKVPLLIRGPGIVEKVSNQPVSLIDLHPTILDLAQIEIPSNIDGKSFVNQFKKRPSNKFKGRKYLFYEYFGEFSNINEKNTECPNDAGLYGCITDNWCKCQDAQNNTYTCVKFFMENINLKYCRFYDEVNFREAYDLIKDPNELINIYDRLNEDVVRHFENVLNRYLMK